MGVATNGKVFVVGIGVIMDDGIGLNCDKHEANQCLLG